MHLTQATLDELREILCRELGDNVTDAELLECALRIIRLVQTIVRWQHRPRGRKATRRRS